MEERTQDERDLKGLIDSHVASTRHSFDIAEPLLSDVIARFPEASANIGVSLRNLHIHGLRFATHSTWSVQSSGTDPDERHKPHRPTYQLSTAWYGSVKKGLFHDKSAQIDLIIRESARSHDHGIYSKRNADHGSTKSAASLEALLGKETLAFELHQKLSEAVTAHEGKFGEVEGSRIARLAFEIADKRYSDRRLDEISVALRDVKAGKNTTTKYLIKITRDQYERSRKSMNNKRLRPGQQKAFLALGSNIGDRVSMIESACREMADRGLTVIKTSALYETKAMYLEEQQPFINGACEVSRAQQFFDMR